MPLVVVEMEHMRVWKKMARCGLLKRQMYWIPMGGRNTDVDEGRRLA
jgi:hypothetical protein